MKISFKPKTKDDWRLLLNLAKGVRLADREGVKAAVEAFERKRKEAEACMSHCSMHKDGAVPGAMG
mgnify:CR=1 FL=1